MKATPDIIESNLSKTAGSFFCEFFEDGIFNHNSFVELVDYIHELNESDITEIERLKKSITIWELAFSINSCLAHHYDKHDVFKIKNLKKDEIRQLSQIVLYISNWFSYNKKMDRESLGFGVW